MLNLAHCNQINKIHVLVSYATRPLNIIKRKGLMLSNINTLVFAEYDPLSNIPKK
ncbi:hypothetical protein HanIR_Chr15g0762471 [Helianthus annuus]|nr:hypothetical protein HanIR_Chr15g0762471 [Helianthus annuus]